MADATVPPEHSRRLFEALRRAGVSVHLRTLRGAGHGGFSEPVTLKLREEFLERSLTQTPGKSAKPEAISTESTDAQTKKQSLSASDFSLLMITSTRRHFVRDLATATATGAGAALAALAPTPVSAQPVPPAASAPGDFNVRDFGAKGDGVVFDTAAIQAAVDACARAGAGRVIVPAGVFLTRTIRLRSNVTLFLEADAVLLGGPKLEDYDVNVPAYVHFDYSHHALIYAEKARNVSLLGKGAIDLQGNRFPLQQEHPGLLWAESAFAVELVQCSNLTVRDITIRNCPIAALRIVAAEVALIDGLFIDNRVRIGCDGIELVCCQRVSVANCRIHSWDDGICLKSSSPDPCRNITITNCVVNSLCNAVKLGTESIGGFENITISNCTIDGGEMNVWTKGRVLAYAPFEGGKPEVFRSINALALELVDGGLMDRINVSGLVIRGVRTAIFVRLGNRGRLYTPKAPKPGIGRLRNVSISNVQAEVIDADHCCSITGLPAHPVEAVTLDNVRLVFPGGGTREAAARVVPERPANYPESTMFGPLPAYALYCRHAKGLTLRNVTCATVVADARPALVCDDVEDLEVSGFRAANSGPEPLVRLRDVRDALLQGCRPGAIENFVKVEGDRSADVALVGNDLRRARLPSAQGGGFAGPITMAGNAEGRTP